MRPFSSTRFGLSLGLVSLAMASYCSSAPSTFYRQHCLFIKKGKLTSYSPRPADILRGYKDSGEDKPLVIHFHGGLVSEAAARNEAWQLYQKCYKGVSYPVYFAWNADFWSQMGNLLEAKYHNTAYLQGHLSTAQFLQKMYAQGRTIGTNIQSAYRSYMKSAPEFQKAVSQEVHKRASQGIDWSKATDLNYWSNAKANLTDSVTNYFAPYLEKTGVRHDSSSVSWSGDLLEWIANNGGGHQVWGQIKGDTAAAFQNSEGAPGAGLLFLQALRLQHPRQRIILVGHSTGCIYALNFMRAAKAYMPGRKFDVVFFAPANTYEDTAAFLRDCPNSIRTFHMFSLRDSAERKDHMLWEVSPQLAGLYPGSLLYFVSRSVEARRNAPLIGLERDLAPHTAAQQPANELVRKTLLDPPGNVIWEPATGPSGQQCNCASHGEFFNDANTIASLRYLVQHV